MTSVEIAWKEEKKPQMPNDDDARHLMMDHMCKSIESSISQLETRRTLIGYNLAHQPIREYFSWQKGPELDMFLV